MTHPPGDVGHGAGSDAGHFAHHPGDVVYLGTTTPACLGTGLRATPSVAASAVAFASPAGVSGRVTSIRVRVDTSPPGTTLRPRAPPA